MMQRAQWGAPRAAPRLALSASPLPSRTVVWKQVLSLEASCFKKQLKQPRFLQRKENKTQVMSVQLNFYMLFVSSPTPCPVVSAPPV